MLGTKVDFAVSAICFIVSVGSFVKAYYDQQKRQKLKNNELYEGGLDE